MERTLWNRKELRGRGALGDGQIEFLKTCMEQNLEHARHVENERLTFNSIYMAMVAGVMALVYGMDGAKGILAIGINFALIVIGLIAMVLTKKWDNTFDRHIRFAQGNYELLHRHYFGDGVDDEEYFEDGVMDDHDPNEHLEGMDELPAYCFRPRNPEGKGILGYFYKKRTRRLFTAFYVLIEIILVVSFVYLIVKNMGAWL